MIEVDGLYQFLNSDPTIRNLVNGRIYGALIPPKASAIYPCIVHVIVTTIPFDSLDGDNPTETTMFQFDCYGRTYVESRILARAVRSLLVPKSDGSGSTPTVSYDLPDGTHVQSARLNKTPDLPFEVGDGGYVFRAMLEIELTYSS